MIFGSYLYWIATDLKLVQVEITDSNVYPQSFNCTLVHMWKKKKISRKKITIMSTITILNPDEEKLRN